MPNRRAAGWNRGGRLTSSRPSSVWPFCGMTNRERAGCPRRRRAEFQYRRLDTRRTVLEQPVEVIEKGHGEPVILVHGDVFGAEMTWQAQEPLAENFHLRLVNRRGFGNSADTAAEDFAVDAHDVVALLSSGAHLVGHSYGAVVALLAAAERPDDVRQRASSCTAAGRGKRRSRSRRSRSPRSPSSSCPEATTPYSTASVTCSKRGCRRSEQSLQEPVTASRRSASPSTTFFRRSGARRHALEDLDTGEEYAMLNEVSKCREAAAA